MLSGTMYGLNSVGFSVMPGAIKTVTLSKYHRVAASPLVLLAPLALSFIALEGYERYNLFSPVPLILGVGIMVTLVYQRARQLTVPLWLAKQSARFGMFSVFMLLTAGYGMLHREY